MKAQTFRFKDSCGKQFCIVANSQADALIKVRQLTNAKTIYAL